MKILKTPIVLLILACSYAIPAFACDSYDSLTTSETTGNNVVGQSTIDNVIVGSNKVTVFFANLTVNPSFTFKCKVLEMQRSDFKGLEGQYEGVKNAFLLASSTGSSVGFWAGSFETQGRRIHRIASFNGIEFQYGVTQADKKVWKY